MMNIGFDDSILVQQFRFFYREVIALKQVVHQDAPEPALPHLPYALDVIHDMAGLSAANVNLVSERLATLLEQQQRMALQYGGDFMLAYEEARYAMVGLADEIFLNADWEGKIAWNFNLLEERLYHTHIAGEEFFRRCDALLVAMRDASKIELAKVYLLALCLGFQGRYRGADPHGDLIRYRRRLYHHIFHGTHHLPEGPKPLFPGTEEHTISAGEMRLLPPIRTWIYRLVGVVVIALVLQHLVWHYLLTSDLWRLADEIIMAQPAVVAK
jgi:type VI secretion system protein ImpK